MHHMEINGSIEKLTPDFEASKKSNNRDWEKSFWQQQSMDVLKQAKDKNQEAVATSELSKGGRNDLNNHVSRAPIHKDLNSNAVKLVEKSESNFQHKFEASNKQDIRAYQNNMQLFSVKESSIIDTKRSELNANRAVKGLEVIQTSMIIKDKKDLKVWTGKGLDASALKAKLEHAFSFFGLNLLELTVRGKKY